MAKEKYKFLSSDVLCSVILFIFFTVVLLQSLSGSDVVLFPKILSIIGLLMSLGVFVSSTEKVIDIPAKNLKEDAVVTCFSAIMFVLMLFVGFLGFFAVLFIISFFLYSYLEYCCGGSFFISLRHTFISSVISCGILFCIFDLLLNIPVPKGILI